MKTKFAIAAIALALTSASAFAAGTIEKGKIDVTGMVLSSSCDITTGGDVSSGIVSLTPIEKNDLVNNQVTGAKDFKVTVTGCNLDSTASNLTVTLSSDDMADAGKGYLKNTVSVNDNPASNVYIGIVSNNDDSKGLFIPDTSTASSSVTKDKVTGTESVDFTYSAGYITGDKTTVGAGAVNGTVFYTVGYN